MKSAKQRLADAHLEERLARARWFNAFETFEARATPANLVDDALGHLKEQAGRTASKAADAVRSRPGTMLAVGSAIGLFLFRKPLWNALAARFSDADDETNAPDEALSQQDYSAAGPKPDPVPEPPLTEEV